MVIRYFTFTNNGSNVDLLATAADCYGNEQDYTYDNLVFVARGEAVSQYLPDRVLTGTEAN